MRRFGEFVGQVAAALVGAAVLAACVGLVALAVRFMAQAVLG